MSFSTGINYIQRHDFDGDGAYEVMPKVRCSPPIAYIFSYDYEQRYVDDRLAGERIQDMDYSYDLDGNGVDDFLCVVNDGSIPESYIYLYRGMLGNSEPGPSAPPSPASLTVEMSDSGPSPGEPFTIDVTVPPIDRAFDAWAVITGNGQTWSCVLDDPSSLRAGLLPLISGVPGLSETVTRRLLSIDSIPASAAGVYRIIIGLAPAFEPVTGPQDAIPGYLFDGEVTVGPRARRGPI
jgi:hypothetical protein